MFEKVNPSHPDKIADRIAGAIVDRAYQLCPNPKIAVEVLIGHGNCRVIVETDAYHFTKTEVKCAIAKVIGWGGYTTSIKIVKQDRILAKNQRHGFRCGDNGIFRGMPVTEEQRQLSQIARQIYGRFDTDGKYILDSDRLIICQSRAYAGHLREMFPNAEINPLGEWYGGTDVDSGATNRKLGSDMADSITGGGLHGKDLSKADVSVNIYAWLKAQATGQPVELSCAIGDTEVDGRPYKEIVEIAREYINSVGGFERFAEWGLV